MRLKKSVKRVLILLILLILGGLVFFLTRSPVIKTVHIEVGQNDVTLDHFMRHSDEQAILKTPITEKLLSTLGEYEIHIEINGKDYVSTMIVEDTVAPSAKSQNVTVYQNQKINPEMFIQNLQDKTEVKVSFQEDVVTTKLGTFPVSIVLEDEGKNQTTVESELIVKKDDVPPVISGLKDITVAKGKTISYKKGVKVTDNVDQDVTLKIDSSKVKLDQIGTYKVTYQAIDDAQNTTEKTIQVHVVSPQNAPVTLADVNERADKVLAKIINNSMSKREKCRKIFQWVHANMSFINDSDKSSWVKAAMYAFTKKKGDCYNYFAITKALLTRAGIENIDLKATKHTHYWNFVKVEEGWYHLDTTPRVDHPNLFLRTDAWIDAYSLKHHNCFSYAKGSKPASARQ